MGTVVEATFATYTYIYMYAGSISTASPRCVMRQIHAGPRSLSRDHLGSFGRIGRDRAGSGVVSNCNLLVFDGPVVSYLIGADLMPI